MIYYFIEIAGGPNKKIEHEVDWTSFSYSYTCIIIFVMTFAMTAPRDVSIYAKINSFGVVFIMIIILFTCAVGFYSLSNTNYTSDKDVYDQYLAEKAAGQKPEYLSYIALF